MVFCSHAAISLWFLLCFQFFGSDFFLNGFPNPFIVHSKPIFLESNLHFSLYFSLYMIFSRNGFPNSLIVLGLVFCLVNNNSLSCTSGLVLLCFFTSSNKNFSLHLSSQLVQHFAWNLFDFSGLVWLFSHSTQSAFRQQLLSKSIQNEASVLKNEISNGNGMNP